MPEEYLMLKDLPVPIDACPLCEDEPFDPMMRGMVQRGKRKWLVGKPRPYCLLICAHCHGMVGYEDPDGNHAFLSSRRLRKEREMLNGCRGISGGI